MTTIMQFNLYWVRVDSQGDLPMGEYGTLAQAEEAIPGALAELLAVAHGDQGTWEATRDGYWYIAPVVNGYEADGEKYDMPTMVERIAHILAPTSPATDYARECLRSDIECRSEGATFEAKLQDFATADHVEDAFGLDLYEDGGLKYAGCDGLWCSLSDMLDAMVTRDKVPAWVQAAKDEQASFSA